MASSIRTLFVASRGGARLLLLTSLLAPWCLAQATTHCVEAESQIGPTLDAALASSETLEEVRIKSGSYLLDSGYFGVIGGTGKTLWISGGWSGAPGKCTDQDGGPADTVFLGLAQRRLFGIDASTTFSGNLIVENMLFVGGFADTDLLPSCLSFGEQNGGVMGVRLDRIRVESCMSDVGINAPTVSVVSSAALIVRNSVFAGNDAGNAVPLSLDLKGGAGFVLNNTIANNVSASSNGFVGMSVSASNGGTITLGNNLLDGNVATAHSRVDMRISGTGIIMKNNRYTGIFGIPDQNIGSSSGSAGFGGNDFELDRRSTARDAGTFFAPLILGELDLYGRARVEGAAVDLGAAEYPAVFEDGFESP